MKKIEPKYFLLLVLLLLKIELINAQDTYIEAGVGIGNVFGNKNARGKGELHFNIIKFYQFGQIGLDISTGGNFIPGITSIEDENIETLSSNDFKFTTITALYRLPIKKHLFVESRLGYSSLFSFVHTDDTTKISQPNFTAGIGIGRHINNFTLSLRYQYLGVTPNYEGSRNMTIVKSNSESFGLLLFRISYRFDLKNLF
ncbi:hypothetical protein H8K90_14185 [Winogradskyella echinorum]|uniref:Outer membrane protein beta-barrel domain-containing protein n=1 Tax=Winogradskyella echinorum TaxID=538189 RepID=A0ABR6Y471_9FLAO|nr:hypothetical protein [Winogradskyella echinorum]MBC3847542.1 hypothetical protein [Winogradskyella echinorum]MBC5751890.1 hypothetical protein [Winogradskyella echinorum]